MISNTGSAPVRLEDLELVYWFQDDPGQTYLFACDWAEIGCENIRGEFQAGEDGAYALRVRFEPGLAPLLSGQESGEIKLRFNRSDWSEFRQSDDYSFSPTPDYVEWEHVAIYSGGNLVWGKEQGAPVVSTISVTATVIPATPLPGPSELVTPTSAQDYPSIPGWTMVGITAVVAFAAGILIAVIFLLKRLR